MLTRRQMALAPIIKTASQRQAEAFGRDAMKVLERALRGVSFDDCLKQKDAENLLFARVRKIMRGHGAAFSRYTYIARRMCKTMVSEIVKAGLTDMVRKKEEGNNAPTDSEG